MIKQVFLTILLFSSLSVLAQEVEENINKYYSLNTFFVEGLGKAGNFSLNFERRYMLSREKAFSIQLGAGPGVNRLTVPLSFYYMKGKGSHYLIGGLGKSFVFRADINSGKFIYHKLSHSREASFWHAQIGYRYQEDIGGVFFQFMYSPIWNADDLPGKEVIGINQWLGISLGYSLKNANVR